MQQQGMNQPGVCILPKTDQALKLATCNALPTGLCMYKLVHLTDLKQHCAEHKGAYTQLTKFSLLLMRVPGLHLFCCIGNEAGQWPVNQGSTWFKLRKTEWIKVNKESLQNDVR